MGRQFRLTRKSQVTIPRDVRQQLGVEPGGLVVFDRNAAGETVIRKAAADAEEVERRREAYRARLRDVAARFAHLRTGEDTDEYMREIREPVPLDPAP
jgi:AbrB family looped-hinge helix DNA binding protein